MASLKDARGLAADLHDLAGRLKSEVDRGSADFTRLVQIADEIGESADQVATTFEAINRSLTSLFEEEPGDEGERRPSRDDGGEGGDGSGSAGRSRSRRAQDGDGARGEKRRGKKND